MLRLMASIEFPAAGGRSLPVYSGYRPQFFFRGEHWECRSIDFASEGAVSPGDNVAATVSLSEYASEHLSATLAAGDVFQLKQGSRTVANGSMNAIEQSP